MAGVVRHVEIGITGDVDWKKVPQDLLLPAIGKVATRPDLVRDHVVYRIEIAHEILERHRSEGVDIAAVLAIIDGHDTTRHAKSLEDAVVKDADKGWRTMPHGMAVIRGGGWPWPRLCAGLGQGGLRGDCGGCERCL